MYHTDSRFPINFKILVILFEILLIQTKNLFESKNRSIYTYSANKNSFKTKFVILAKGKRFLKYGFVMAFILAFTGRHINVLNRAR